MLMAACGVSLKELVLEAMSEILLVSDCMGLQAMFQEMRWSSLRYLFPIPPIAFQ